MIIGATQESVVHNRRNRAKTGVVASNTSIDYTGTNAKNGEEYKHQRSTTVINNQ